MSFEDILKELPECELLRVLYEKACEKKETDFDCFGELERFRKTVAGEVRQINQLFDEYTPHDEEHHLKPLFKLADEILGRERFEAMECGELFVLAVALYSHDWGMAVSEPEKEYICTGKVREGHRREDFAVLSDEKKRLWEFARDYYLKMDESGWLKQVPPKEIWRDYVRVTHAYRSGEKVRRYFEPINGSVAEAACWVCVGHGLDFEQLQSPEIYPVNQSILDKSANVRALAVYLRLIDLLDLGENRTPYVIWKFVAPKNPRSKMEWAKHRALRGATFPPYQRGREIRIDGSTDDHEVYAALEDLRLFVEEQLRGCNDTLAQIPGERHTLDLYNVDWQVRARGFEKVSIRFQFDRDRMFEILGEEIYQDDPYVFLRELLQNSIDAIRLRREVLRQRAGIEPKDFGEIRVTVNHRESGDAEIIWSDNGIGMDEHVVKNYLAVGGRSYYRSKEFEAEGINIDPISRFGIGILSCFMVADQVEIETCKDRNLPPPSEPLRIIIPDMRRQFRIEKRHEDAPRIGTTVRVLVDGRKLPKEEEDNRPKPLDVTAYLSVVAGFVEFPIIVTEGDHKTIVLHPKQDPEGARNRYGGDFRVQRLTLDYPWNEAIVPQDLAIARKCFEEKRLDLASDLGLEGYEGTLSYPYPRQETVDFTEVMGSAHMFIRGEGEVTKKTIRFVPGWGRRLASEHSGLSRSCSRGIDYAVYRDGVLVPAAPNPSSWRKEIPWMSPSSPYLVVNIPKSKAPRLDLARAQLVGDRRPWDRAIFEAHARHILTSKLRDLLKLDPCKRAYQLGRLIVCHQLTPDILWDVFPKNHWPIVFLEQGGGLMGLEWQEIAEAPIYSFPSPIPIDLSRLCHFRWFLKKPYKGPLISWEGDPCPIGKPDGRRMYFEPSASALEAADLWRVPVESTHRLTAIRFLVPPWKESPPLAQPLWEPIVGPKKRTNLQEVLQKAARDPHLLEPAERGVLCDALAEGRFGFPTLVEFHRPFARFLAYGDQFLNTANPMASLALRVDAALKLDSARRQYPPDVLGRIKDALDSFWSNLGSSQALDAFRKMSKLVCQAGMFPVPDLEDLASGAEQYVPGTEGRGWTNFVDKWELSRAEQPFGMPLT